jgi:hypothetical protein
MTNFPLTLNIDQGRIPYKMTVKDASGTTLMQAVQLAKLKRQIEVTTYQNHQQQTYQLTAEKLMAMRPVYDIWTQPGQTIGTIASQKALAGEQYDVSDGKTSIFQTQREPNPRQTRSLLIFLAIAIVLLGLTFYQPTILAIVCVFFGISTFAFRGGYFGGTTYSVKRPDGRRVMLFTQIPHLNLNQVEYSVRLLDRVSSSTEEYFALFSITLILLERSSSAD